MKILFVFGTRPEAIKMAPLIKSMSRGGVFFPVVCITGQHREMLDQVLEFFEINVDFDLNIMSAGQSLNEVTARSIERLGPVFECTTPDIVFVQGDTTSTLTGALAAFYARVPVCHLEAGLRSGDKYSPFPEEVNRVLAARLADYHFAPTEKAFNNLVIEGVSQKIWMVGNTVIDALKMGLQLIQQRGDDQYRRKFDYLKETRRVILVTGHRRESFGRGFEDITGALRELATAYPDIDFVYPVHMNPNVTSAVRNALNGIGNFRLISPVSYPEMLWLLTKSYCVITDSGGVQEEAPSFGKPVVVTRNVTERTEAVDAGAARLVGTDRRKIVAAVTELVENEEVYRRMSRAVNPYGDGCASDRIIDILKKELLERAA